MKDLKKEIEKTTKLLERLEQERSSFRLNMTAAVNEADSKAIIALKHRAAEVPVEIDAARIRIAKLELQLDEERLPELRSRVQGIAEPTQAALEKQKEAIADFQRLQSELYAAEADARELNIRIGERRRTLQRLIAEANPARDKTGQMLTHFGSR